MELETYKFKDKKDNEEVKRIASITWISNYMAMVFFIKFGYKIFESKKAMFAYLWLDPKTRTSGSSVDMKKRLSKRWNKYVRKKLHQAAFCAVRHSKYFKSIYDRLKNNWKHHFTCLITVEKKIVHIIRSMKKYNTYFDDSRFDI